MNSINGIVNILKQFNDKITENKIAVEEQKKLSSEAYSEDENSMIGATHIVEICFLAGGIFGGRHFKPNKDSLADVGNRVACIAISGMSTLLLWDLFNTQDALPSPRSIIDLNYEKKLENFKEFIVYKGKELNMDVVSKIGQFLLEV